MEALQGQIWISKREEIQNKEMRNGERALVIRTQKGKYWKRKEFIKKTIRGHGTEEGSPQWNLIAQEVGHWKEIIKGNMESIWRLLENEKGVEVFFDGQEDTNTPYIGMRSEKRDCIEWVKKKYGTLKIDDIRWMGSEVYRINMVLYYSYIRKCETYWPTR